MGMHLLSVSISLRLKRTAMMGFHLQRLPDVRRKSKAY